MATRQRLDDLRANCDPPEPEGVTDVAPPACADCASELVPGAAFCGECGTPVPLADEPTPEEQAGEEPAGHEAAPPTCGSCETDLVAGAAFCGECGAPVEPIATGPELEEPELEEPELEEPEPDESAETEPELAPVEPAPVAARRRRRAPLVVAGVAAVLALLGGLALALPGSGGDDEVAAGDTTTTTARPRDARDSGRSTSGDASAGVESPAAGEQPPGADGTAAPDAGAPAADATPAVAGGTAPATGGGGTPAPSGAPAPGPPPPSPTPTAPPPPPPPPARLVVTSDCNGTCVVPRGGRFTLTIANVGGQTGQFTVSSSHPALVPYPSIGTIPGGGSRTVEVVDESGRRRLGLTVEVRGPGGGVIWSATVDLRGT